MSGALSDVELFVVKRGLWWGVTPWQVAPFPCLDLPRMSSFLNRNFLRFAISLDKEN